ncbi:hypothetical protein QTP88_025152 [Uroleucon formosanum]
MYRFRARISLRRLRVALRAGIHRARAFCQTLRRRNGGTARYSRDCEKTHIRTYAEFPTAAASRPMSLRSFVRTAPARWREPTTAGTKTYDIIAGRVVDPSSLGSVSSVRFARAECGNKNDIVCARPKKKKPYERTKNDAMTTPPQPQPQPPPSFSAKHIFRYLVGRAQIQSVMQLYKNYKSFGIYTIGAATASPEQTCMGADA